MVFLSQQELCLGVCEGLGIGEMDRFFSFGIRELQKLGKDLEKSSGPSLCGKGSLNETI